MEYTFGRTLCVMDVSATIKEGHLFLHRLSLRRRLQAYRGGIVDVGAIGVEI